MSKVMPENMSKQEKSYLDRYSAWEKVRYGPPPERDLEPVTPAIVEQVPLRDGIKLYTEIFLPQGEAEAGIYPVILMRSPYPYSKHSRFGAEEVAYFIDAGYAMVFQLTRGQGESEGNFRTYRDEAADGYD